MSLPGQPPVSRDLWCSQHLLETPATFYGRSLHLRPHSVAGRAVCQVPGMPCRVTLVVQHEAPELALPDRSLHALPRPLKMAVRLGLVAPILCHRYACNSAEQGVLYYCPQDNCSTTFLWRRFSIEATEVFEVRTFHQRTSRRLGRFEMHAHARPVTHLDTMRNRLQSVGGQTHIRPQTLGWGSRFL